MRKQYILFLLLFHVVYLNAQNIPPLGARWCYWKLHQTGNLYLSESVRIETEKDTTIGSDVYRKLNAYSVDKLGNEAYLTTYLLHDSSGYVYYIRNNERGLLFNFNAQLNDSVEVSIYSDKTSPMIKQKVKVTGINTDTLGLKTFTLNNTGFGITQRIINRVYVGDFLPLQVPLALDGSSILRTYTDGTITTGDTTQPCAVSSYISFFGTTAQWYYSLWRADSLQAGYFYRVLAQGDTTLSGKICKVVKVFDSYGQPVSGAHFYMYEQAKKVFIWKENQFRLIYNFDAKIGDTITAAVIYHPALRVFETHTNPGISEVRYIVKHKRMVDYRIHWDIEYLDSGWRFSDAIVEGIGSMFGFFGGSYTSTSVGLAGNLRCYFNVSHGVNYGNSSQCDKILSVDEISRYQHLKLYPNPTFDKVSLPENFVNSEFEVYSTTGKMILNGILPNTVSIDLSLLPSGIYFIRLTQTNQHAVVVKE
jgi:hypothetical protein